MAKFTFKVKDCEKSCACEKGLFDVITKYHTK